jgi:hypothetical protein
MCALPSRTAVKHTGAAHQAFDIEIITAESVKSSPRRLFTYKTRFITDWLETKPHIRRVGGDVV